MNVKELIEELQKYPEDAIVYREGGEYKDDYVPIYSVEIFPGGWGLEKGILIE